MQNIPSNQRKNTLSAHGTFSRLDLVLDHKASLSKFEMVEIISSVYSDHSSMKLEMNSKGKLKNSQICGNKTTHF